LSKNLIEKICSDGIHAFLGFDGKIMLSSIMPDRLLLRDEIFDLFYRVALLGGFDAVIGWDMPVYLDLPLRVSWVNLLKALNFTFKLCKLPIPVIGLLKGNSHSQIRFYLNNL